MAAEYVRELSNRTGVTHAWRNKPKGGLVVIWLGGRCQARGSHFGREGGRWPDGADYPAVRSTARFSSEAPVLLALVLLLFAWVNVARAGVPESVSPSAVLVPEEPLSGRPGGLADSRSPTRAGYALGEIVVSAARAEQGVFEVPQFVSVIASKEIEDRIPASTPDLFDRLAGVLVQKTNLGGGSVFLRGLTGKHILLLVDGVRLNNSLYRFGPHQYLNTIDPNLIERIEVVRGPMSVLYGSDAMGGTVNLITRKRADFQREKGWNGLLCGKYGSAAAERAGRVQVEANVHRFGALMGATYRGFDDLDGGRGVGVQTPTGYEEVDADAKLNLWAAEGQEFTLATQFSRQFDVPKTSEVTLGGNRKFNYEPQLRSLQYVRYEGKDLVDGRLQSALVNVSYNLQAEGEEVIKSDPDLETRERNGADTLGALVHLRAAKWRLLQLSGGAEFYQDWISSSKQETDRRTGLMKTLKSAFPDGAVYRSAGVYLQDETPLGERATLTLGGRYSHVVTSGVLRDPATGSSNPLFLEADNLAGAAHLRVACTRWLCLVGGVAQGFRAPNMEDFFGKVDFTTEIPNPRLRPERSWNTEVGLKAQHQVFEGNLFGFWSEYEDLIERVEVAVAGKTFLQRQNVTRARLTGIEFDFRLHLPLDLTLQGTCSWMRGTNLTLDQPLRRIPPVSGSLTVRYQPGGRYWVEGYGLFAGLQDRLSPQDRQDRRIPEGGTPGFAVFGLSGGVEVLAGVEAILSVENITDDKYKTHGSGIYGPGTNVMLAGRYRF